MCWCAKISLKASNMVMKVSGKVCMPELYFTKVLVGKEKLSSIIASFLAGNGSYDGSINYYQKKKCGKVWESMFSHIYLLSLRA